MVQALRHAPFFMTANMEKNTTQKGLDASSKGMMCIEGHEEDQDYGPKFTEFKQLNYYPQIMFRTTSGQDLDNGLSSHEHSPSLAKHIKYQIMVPNRDYRMLTPTPDTQLR